MMNMETYKKISSKILEIERYFNYIDECITTFKYISCTKSFSNIADINFYNSLGDDLNTNIFECYFQDDVRKLIIDFKFFEYGAVEFCLSTNVNTMYKCEWKEFKDLFMYNFKTINDIENFLNNS